MNLLKTKRNPLIIFIFIYIIYNLLGLVNFGYFNDDFNVKVPVLLFIIGLLGIIFGYYFSKILIILFFKTRTFKLYKTEHKATLFLLNSSFIVSLIFLIYLYASMGGIPIMLGEARFSLNPILFNGMRIFEYVFFYYYIESKMYNFNIKKKYIFYLFIYLLLSLGAGYRTPIVELIGMYFLFNYIFIYNKKQLIKNFLFLLIVGFLFTSIVSMYRVSINYDIFSFFKNIDIDFFLKYKLLLPLMPSISLLRYSQYTIHEIINNLDDNFLHGYLFISNYITLLPGEQPGERNIVGEIINARIINGKFMSTTPTLQGAFYIDFGIAGVFFGFFFIAIIYNLLIKKIKYNYNPILVFVSLYIFTNLIISIHVGYWDIIVLIFIFITFLILSFLLLFGIKIIKLRY